MNGNSWGQKPCLTELSIEACEKLIFNKDLPAYIDFNEAGCKSDRPGSTQTLRRSKKDLLVFEQAVEIQDNTAS